ncbi:site-specific integrase [Sporosarcina sp. P16b]|uniref:tyrosine-type recombinase/integrase n=1 Tax=Sporosarcina sp. P16b TaxID=2048261 RepID=UPI000C167C9E|nr:tyrosine-type recombinase/integrase [Sporosarcina sp. P16b]PIC71150.1 site-specific integrase [Sporosarcina sp. P16b]
MSGSIQDRKNGSYLLTYSMGFNAQGKRKRKTRTVKAKNMTEAKKKLAAFVTEIEGGNYIDPTNMSFGAFAHDWFEKSAKRNLSPSTLSSYENTLKRHILPNFADMKMDSIKPIHVTDYLISLETTRLDGKKKVGLAPATIKKHHDLLSNIFQFAIKNGSIKTNPVTNSEKPTQKKTETAVYTTEEVRQLFAMLDDEGVKHSLMIRLAIETGMRRGEILGLQWNDIDFESYKIHINHSLSYTKESGYTLGSTKNKKRRVVIGSKGLMNRLAEFYKVRRMDKLQASELWEGGQHFYVFSDWNGKPLHPDTPSRWWLRFLNRSGFKKIRFHDLRHTAATLLINQGVHAKIISERLGHSNISITMDVYGHYLEEANQLAANVFDDLFESPTQQRHI